MTSGNGHQHTTGSDVIVIGAGLSGLMAAVTAVDAGARVRLIASGWGQQIVTPGWLSVCDRAEDDVIAEVRGYAAIHPDHPYALAEDDAMVHGLDAFRDITARIGLPYDERTKDGHNMRLMTTLGAIRTPMMAPRSLAAGDLTDIDGPVLVVGFRGWRDFFPQLAVDNLRQQGIDARALTVALPDTGHATWDEWPGDLARLFDSEDVRAGIAKQVKRHARGTAKIGFPAVLGLDAPGAALRDLTATLGRPVFEIPTLPPSAAGVRLSNRLRRWLLRQRARVQIGHAVTRGIVEDRRCLAVQVQALGHLNTFYADHVILATGGLYNGGIESDDTGRIWEPIFDLPVEQPRGEGRAEWFYDHLLVQHGHPVHRYTGVRVNLDLLPLDADGEPVLDNVYVIGNMLAGFNPITDGCAEGIQLATAYKAVQTALGLKN
jgi:glycerol-3-phosphate dehydrogenase subunit B